MDARTANALGRLTRGFYERSASGFSARGTLPWPGWTRVLDHLAPRLAALPQIAVLDIGCGNARLAPLLARTLERPVAYTGLDASPSLVARARVAHGDVQGARFEVCDVLAAPPDEVLPRGPFDLVVLFGLLHHVPGWARRRSFLGAVVDRLASRGALALSSWRMPDGERMRRRVVAWEGRGSTQADLPLDGRQVEPGDYLIEKPGHGARYCHLLDGDEVRRLVDGLPLELVTSFQSDGRSDDLNLYFLWLRSGAGPAATRGGAVGGAS